MTTNSIVPFDISIPAAEVDDLQRRLAATRWPQELPDVGWSHGIPTSYVRELANYWATSFDWDAQQADLNRYPQFVAEIDGQRLHFAHIRSSDPDAVPLVLIHGWPFEDFRDTIGPMTDPKAHGDGQATAFHLVVPTLPGFGFSGPTTRAGDADTARSAELICQLMDELGYDRYGVHGGDAGSFVAPQMGRIAPERVVGVHLNGPITIPSRGEDGSGFTDEDKEKLARLQDWSNSQTSAYAAVHSTRPATLAPALTDSPAGLLAWVVDVVNSYIDPAASGPDDAMSRDMLLAQVSILWFTGTIGSSIRVYKESSMWGADVASSGVPTAAAVFARDSSIRGIAEKQHNIVRWTEFDHGGHFAAMETSGDLVDDIRAFFADLVA
jgi:pimeloyl-ACP methyl ester carboxylesterase